MGVVCHHSPSRKLIRTLEMNSTLHWFDRTKLHVLKYIKKLMSSDNTTINYTDSPISFYFLCELRWKIIL